MKYLLMLFIISCLLSVSAKAEQGAKTLFFDEEDNKNVTEFLSNPQNPFISQLPKEKPAPKPVVVEPITVEQPQNVQPVPAEPPPRPKTDPASLNLKASAIVWGSEQPQAIINDNIFTLGETVSGAKIVSISREGVRMSLEDQEFLLTVE